MVATRADPATPGTRQCLVKWRGLEYDKATWEPRDEVEEEAAEALERVGGWGGGGGLIGWVDGWVDGWIGVLRAGMLRGSWRRRGGGGGCHSAGKGGGQAKARQAGARQAGSGGCIQSTPAGPGQPCFVLPRPSHPDRCLDRHGTPTLQPLRLCSVNAARSCTWCRTRRQRSARGRGALLRGWRRSRPSLDVACSSRIIRWKASAAAALRLWAHERRPAIAVALPHPPAHACRPLPRCCLFLQASAGRWAS